ncbi:GLPGLI family protein [Polaribacter sp. Asnod6-C07]|uniref:GLPGLI family protein n=1 Tax=Polaribacter sp. Asnod6-C07 TaxID=3160582 RepID=UPI0038662B35
MKSLKFYIYFFLSINCFSQSGEIIYSAEIMPIDYKKKLNNDTIPETQKTYLRNVLKKQLAVLYQLVFNKNESFFEKQKPMEIERRGFNLTVSKMGKGVFYTNKFQNRTLHQKEYVGQEFLISITPYEWKLTQEKKQIGNYTCYKATTSKFVEGRNGKMERKVVAWYTNEVPFNFGPKDYNGLPGLILELQEDILLIKATKISLNPKKKKLIKKPSQGEKVTLKEYNAIVKEMYNSRFKRN